MVGDFSRANAPLFPPGLVLRLVPVQRREATDLWPPDWNFVERIGLDGPPSRLDVRPWACPCGSVSLAFSNIVGLKGEQRGEFESVERSVATFCGVVLHGVSVEIWMVFGSRKSVFQICLIKKAGAI